MEKYPIILASSSPRRKEILSLLGVPFSIKSVCVDESFITNDPVDNAIRIARSKALAAVTSLDVPSVVITADTFISLPPVLLGKPKDDNDAVYMLKKLSGTVHEVLTGYCVYLPTENIYKNGVDITKVTFCDLSSDDILWYIQSGEWENAAGSYKIQGLAACFITEIKGSFHNVMGLPIHKIYGILSQTNYLLP